MSVAEMVAQKSLIITYLLWLFLGWLGAHHFYLGRDRHAFVWFWTMGGCCCVGWFLELFRLRSYVELANGYGDEVIRQRTSTSRHRQPEFAVKRFAGEMVFAMFLGFLSAAAIPEELAIDWRLEAVLAFVCCAIGEYLGLYIYVLSSVLVDTEC
jgi:DnaJ homolog subfamily C member 22